ncbi:MAG: hypothetical protein JW776_11630 [Candidatus Lokiarchaeota archaeon]|nr:hypothetical protein [Candidatus Lokiarchaeota archaeon]
MNKKSLVRRYVQKDMIFPARVFQIMARLMMVALAIEGIIRIFYNFFTQQFNQPSNAIFISILEYSTIIFMIMFSLYNEPLGSLFWIIYSILAFLFHYYGIMFFIRSNLTNWVSLLFGLVIGVFLILSWLVEERDPLNKIRQRLDNKDFSSI